MPTILRKKYIPQLYQPNISSKKIWDERDCEVILSITLEMPVDIVEKDSESLVWHGPGAHKEEGD